jgi:hypothetical protein
MRQCFPIFGSDPILTPENWQAKRAFGEGRPITVDSQTLKNGELFCEFVGIMKKHQFVLE